MYSRLQVTGLHDTDTFLSLIRQSRVSILNSINSDTGATNVRVQTAGYRRLWWMCISEEEETYTTKGGAIAFSGVIFALRIKRGTSCSFTQATFKVCSSEPWRSATGPVYDQQAHRNTLLPLQSNSVITSWIGLNILCRYKHVSLEPRSILSRSILTK
jgi:hypothetical protein